jgi:hypothetical protein
MFGRFNVIAEGGRRRDLLVGSVLVLAGLGAVLAVLIVSSSPAESKSKELPFAVMHEETKAIAVGEIPHRVSVLFGMMGRLDEVDSASSVEWNGESGRQHLYVLETADQVCLASESASGTCGSHDAALEGSLYSVSPRGCAGALVIGLVPDGVDQLRVEAEGKEIRVPVRDNVYQAKLPAVDSIVSGKGIKRFGLPLGWYASQSSSCQK